VEPGVDDSYELITYGCLPPKEKTRMQCNTPDHVHKKQLSMECCRHADMCNTLLQPSLPTTPSPTTGTGLLLFWFETGWVLLLVLNEYLFLVYILIKYARTNVWCTAANWMNCLVCLSTTVHRILFEVNKCGGVRSRFPCRTQK